MTDYEIITVATHKYGLYEKLINNDFRVNITTLGMGMKWTGFRMKYELIYNYIKNMNDNKIIIFLDGFDSKINKNPQIAIDYFIKNNYKILFSKQNNHCLFNSNKITNLILNKIFLNKKNSLKNNCIPNTGLYMGYVKYLKAVLFELLLLPCNDDQVLLSRNLTRFDYINIDENEELFQNLNNTNDIKNSVFIQYPGNFTFSRIIKRGLFEYGQFYIKVVYFIIIIFNLLVIRFDKFNLLPINTIFYYYLQKIDKSCI